MNKKERLARIEELKERLAYEEKQLKLETEITPIGVANVHSVTEAKNIQIIDVSEVELTENVSKEEKFRIEYYRKGNQIICKIRENGFIKIEGVGRARCNEEDSFKYGFGLVLAELRAKADLYNKMANNFVDQVYDNDLLHIFK